MPGPARRSLEDRNDDGDHDGNVKTMPAKVSAFLAAFVAWVRDITRPRDDLRDPVLRANLRRLVIVCAVGIPVSAAHVALFWLDAPRDTPTQALWREGIMASHTILVLLESVFLVAGYRLLLGDTRSWPLYLTQYSAITSVLVAGAGIAAVDQLVTPNITPFLVAAVLVAVIFILHPLAAVVIYGAGFVLFYWSMGLYQQTETILLSNRVNGLTAVGLGFSLAVMLWTSYVRRAEQQAYIADQQQRLEALATVDPLTGVLNRRRFEETVATEVARLQRTGDTSCLLLMDMDHFKAINDRHGHPAGDQALRFVAGLLKQNLRRYDTLARWGGEEFIMLFPGTPVSAGLEIAEKLRRSLEAAAFAAGGHSIPLTASFGLVPLRTGGAGAFAESYARADAALYAAKYLGRNRVEVDDGTKQQLHNPDPAHP